MVAMMGIMAIPAPEIPVFDMPINRQEKMTSENSKLVS
jgi:hypothetical protein